MIVQKSENLRLTFGGVLMNISKPERRTTMNPNSLTATLTFAAMLSIAPICNAQEFDFSDQLHGVAKPSELAELPSLVPGTIVEVHVKEGQFVKKGTPLVTMDDRVPKARLMAATVEANLTGALKRAEVEHRLAISRLNRIRAALSRGAGAGFELEEAEGVRDQAAAAVEQQRDILKAAEANRRLAEAQLAQYTISAPFDGLVTEIHRKSGAIDPSQLIVTMANLSTLEVEMHLPSRIYGTVRRGETIDLKAGAPISDSVHASVVSVSPIIDSASNTFRCLLQIENSEMQLPAGFSVVLNKPIDADTRVSRVSNAR